MIWVILPLVLLAEGIFPYLVPFFFSILQPSLDFSGQSSALQAVSIVVPGKVLMGVLAGLVADGVALCPDHAVLYSPLRPHRQVCHPAKAPAFESTIDNHHTQKAGAKPREYRGAVALTEPLVDTRMK